MGSCGGNSGLGEDIRGKRDVMARQIKDRNDTKAKEKAEAEEKRRVELEELEMRKKGDELERQEALVCGRSIGRNFAEIEDGFGGDSLDDALANSVSGEDVAEAIGVVPKLPPLPQRGGQRNRVGWMAWAPVRVVMMKTLVGDWVWLVRWTRRVL